MGYQRARDRQTRQGNYNTSELSTVTSSGGKEINALGVGEYREVPLVAPFGIRWNPPAGESVQLIKNWHMGSNIVAVGTIVDEEIPPGEVELYSKGGAKIRLKNNGDVVINELVIITIDGDIITPKNINAGENITVGKNVDVSGVVTASNFIRK